jgi:uncharacterized membrane protein YcaP (DUF421 family)
MELLIPGVIIGVFIALVAFRLMGKKKIEPKEYVKTCWIIGILSILGSPIARLADYDRITKRYDLLADVLLFFGIGLIVTGIVIYITMKFSKRIK